ncbi:sensor histidine kinase [Nakamurella sp.]|uniref:sensor histidine kinase n=1 Tax=Nakamurella sp. TaxID=1869182 RepID=UPI003B3B77D0
MVRRRLRAGGLTGERRPEPPVRSPALTRALWFVGGSLLLVAALEQLLLITEVRPGPLWVLTLIPLAAIGYGCAGLLAWSRRPSNRVGAVLVLAAWFWLIAGLANTDVPVLVGIGFAGATLVVAVLVHLLLVFPTGRAGTPAARAVIALAYLACTVFEVLGHLFDPAGATPLQLADRPELDEVISRVQLGLLLVAVAGAAGLVVRRLAAGSAATRRALGPVAAGIFASLALTLLGPNVFVPLFGWSLQVLFVVQVAALAAVPVLLLAGMLAGGFARTGEVVELGAWLGPEPSPADLAAALARTLGDPTARVGFRLAGTDRYVDPDSGPLPVDRPGPGRAVELVRIGDDPVGVIEFDPALVADRDLVRTAGRVLATAVDRQRLVVSLTASRDELRRSRARIVQEGEQARRQVARDLHDGLQTRLVVLAIHVQTLAGRVPPAHLAELHRLRAELDSAIAELRGLVHSVMPSLLIERGLRAAAQEVVDRMPMATDFRAPEELGPLPAPVESAAYFVVTEGLTNAAKHAGAGRLRVTLEVAAGELRVEVSDDGVGGARTGSAVGSGTGLRSLADRVEALGGVLTVDSPPGGGTTVRAVLPGAMPCG